MTNPEFPKPESRQPVPKVVRGVTPGTESNKRILDAFVDPEKLTEGFALSRENIYGETGPYPFVKNKPEASDADVGQALYFIREKGDVTRWCGWEEKRALVFQRYPELHAATQGLDAAEKTLKRICESIDEELDY